MARWETTPAIERVLRRCVREDRGHETPCLIWTGGKTGGGYGKLGTGSEADGTNRTRETHAIVWEAANGPLTNGQRENVHHLCEQKLCCELSHLVLLTSREHHERHAPTHCPHGHEFTPENTGVYVRSDGARCRRCRACDREKHRARYARRPRP